MRISEQHDALVFTPAAPARRPVTVRIGRWSATHPWRAISLWLAFVASCVLIGELAGLHSMSNVDGTVGQSGHAARLLQQPGLDPADTENVLITARQGSLDTGLARTAAAAVTSGMGGLPEVTAVAAPVTSRDETAMLVGVTLKNQTTNVEHLMSATAAVQRSYPRLRVEEVGDVSMNAAVNDQVSKDLGAAATFSLPVTLLIMLIAFGAIVAAGVPVLLAMSAVAAATGFSALVSHVIPDSGSTSSMILLMGMAVGVDYSLFFVKRTREERHRGHTHLDAIEIAAETSGHSVLVSGAAVIVSMLGMFMARYTVFSSLAAGSIIVVAVAVLGSLTVLPAILVKLGNRIDRPRIPVLWRWSSQTREPRLWPALLRPTMSHPARTLAISAGAMALLALPALGLHLASDTARSLPSSITEVHALSRLDAAFPSNNTSFDVVVTAPAVEADAVRARLAELSRRLGRDGRFATPTSNAEVRASVDGTVHAVEIDAPFDAESPHARADLAALRSTLVPRGVADIPAAGWAVGGQTAYAVDIDNRLGDAIPWVIGFVVLLTLVITGWAFRSVTLAVSTALLNLLSAAAAFGVLTLTFQHTWAQRLLDFKSTGAVINWIPLFTFAVLFGLSMDYHIFVISRIREAAASGMATSDAVRAGITESAGTVTSAAAVMISVFAIFASLHMVEMKELGFGLAVAVLLDTLVVRVIILPSLMLLLGPWNWWPGGHPNQRQAQATHEAVLTRV
jgi:RND superfamily putative drug exporter